jgi:cytochrome b6-f complex iron-sulfur subunit
MVHSSSTDTEHDPNRSAPRRDFLLLVSSITMGGGLLASYGTFVAMAGRYLYSDDEESDWQFVALTREVKLGEARQYITPAGGKVVIARQSEGETAEAFAALSSTCPHLGCQVHWEPQNKRFFCPCHNGAFDPDGKAIAGPPAQARQSLIRFELKVDNGLLYVRVPSRALSLAKES